MASVFPPKPNALNELFGVPKPVIGMLHLPPLPGAPRYQGEPLSRIIDAALEELERYREGGVDGLIVENQGDLPFAKPQDIGPETVAAMTAVAQMVVRGAGFPVGINVLSNAAIPALAVAQAAGARFIRVSQWANAYVGNSGLIEAAAPAALRYRARIKAEHVRVFSDVHVKHGSHAIVADRPIREQAQDAAWFDSDVLIATGTRTGEATPVEEVGHLRGGHGLPVIVGSGFDLRNCAEILAAADGAIVGTSLKRDGLWWNPVETSRVRALMDAVRAFRSGLK
ncbi:MAG: BtpA/SgcQ family protein [Meiothermus sp.]|nr:BtpA/SgcQ family protein [Meiothermus sp.]